MPTLAVLTRQGVSDDVPERPAGVTGSAVHQRVSILDDSPLPEPDVADGDLLQDDDDSGRGLAVHNRLNRRRVRPVGDTRSRESQIVVAHARTQPLRARDADRSSVRGRDGRRLRHFC